MAGSVKKQAGGSMSECTYCAGTGYVDFFNESLHDWEEAECDECGGSGFDDDDEEESP